MTLIADIGDFGNQRFESRDSNLTSFAASKAVYCVGSYEADYQICQVGFGKRDGSIFVSTPYFGHSSGIIANATIPESPPLTVSLQKGGKISAHQVKLSHHPDGRVHFSQDGKVKTVVSRQSFPLPSSIGRVFELHVYWPAGFRMLTWKNRRKDRLYLRNKFRGALPSAVTVSAEWRRKKSIIDNIEPKGSSAGPIGPVRHRRTGDEGVVQFFGQPEGFPLRDHVLMLSCYPAKPLKNIQECTMILIGGWDPHEVQSSGETAKQTGCLAWMYPVSDPEKLSSTIGSIDLIGPYAVSHELSMR